MALEREQVPANRKWRTEDIFATQEDWEALYGKVEAAVAAFPITTTPCVCSSRKSRTSFHRKRRRSFRRVPACLTAAVRFSVCWTTPTSLSPPSR